MLHLSLLPLSVYWVHTCPKSFACEGQFPFQDAVKQESVNALANRNQ